MENKKLISPQDIQIQGLLDRYLRSQNSKNNSALQQQHLDEDSLAAFTEGNLSESEARPIVSHLVDCSFCRHVTAELVRLDLAFADENVQVAATENQPSKISEVLSNLLSRIFGTSDGAVFAHEEKEQEEESEKADNKEDNKK
jgi:lipase chaperone LimK